MIPDSSQRSPIFMRPLLLPVLLSAVLPVFAVAEPVSPATPAVVAESHTPLRAGDAVPAGLLPTAWLQGEPVTGFEPGVTYFITRWNPYDRYRSDMPGSNLARALERPPEGARFRVILVAEMNPADSDKVRARLKRPVLATPHAIAVAAPGSDLAKTLARLPAQGNRSDVDTVILRDGVVLRVAEGRNLVRNDVRDYFATDFDWARHQAERALLDERFARMLVLSKEMTKASARADHARVEEILAVFEKEKNPHAFIAQRLRDTRCFIALQRGDIPGALEQIRLLSDAVPDDPAMQTWTHKMVLQNEPLVIPGQALAGELATRVARLRRGDAARAWWMVAADHFEAAGDKARQLAALEEAEKLSDPVRTLESMKNGAL